MEAIVLFLVVLGDFQLSTRWTRTRFEILREDGHKLYFKSAYYGICVFLTTYAIVLLMEGVIGSIRDGRLYSLSIERVISANELILVAAVLTLFIGRHLPTFLNRLQDPEQDLRRAIQDDDFEKFLHSAAVRQRLVSITMANRKIYIGWILETMDPTNERKHITLLPLFSGYRDENGKTELTTR